MTTRSFTRRAAAAAGASLSAAALVAASVQPSVGSPPQRIPIDEHFAFETVTCGVPTGVVGSNTGSLLVRSLGPGGVQYFASQLAGEVTNTNLLTGTSVHLTIDLRERDQRIVVNDDGTLTITFRVTFNETDYNPDGSVRFRSAGQDTVHVVVDANGTPGDPEDDIVVSEDYLGFTGHDGRAGTDFCEWYVAVTS